MVGFSGRGPVALVLFASLLVAGAGTIVTGGPVATRDGAADPPLLDADAVRALAMPRSDPEETIHQQCVVMLGDDLADELCTAQYDGGAHGDAPEACGVSERGIEVPAPDPRTNGLVHPFDDVDRFRVAVGPGVPQLEVVLRASPLTDGLTQLFAFDLSLRPVNANGCGPPVGNVTHVARDEVRVTLVGPEPGLYDLGVHRDGFLLGPGGLPPLSPEASLPSTAAPEDRAADRDGDQVCHGACLVASNRLFGYEFAAR